MVTGHYFWRPVCLLLICLLLCVDVAQGGICSEAKVKKCYKRLNRMMMTQTEIGVFDPQHEIRFACSEKIKADWECVANFVDYCVDSQNADEYMKYSMLISPEHLNTICDAMSGPAKCTEGEVLCPDYENVTTVCINKKYLWYGGLICPQYILFNWCSPYHKTCRYHFDGGQYCLDDVFSCAKSMCVGKVLQLDEEIKLRINIPPDEEEKIWNTLPQKCYTLMSSGKDDLLKRRMLQNKKNPGFFYNIIKTLDVDTIITTIKEEIPIMQSDDDLPMISALGEELTKKLGGAKNLKVSDLKDLGSAVVISLRPGDLKYLSGEVFKFILSQISNETSKGIEENYIKSKVIYDDSAVPKVILSREDGIRLKALCNRAFRMYENPTDINSAEGWENIKYLLFCAPPKVCKNVDNNLIQNDLTAIGDQIWTCLDVQKFIERGDDATKHEDSPVGDENKLLKKVDRLFPSNKLCGKIVAEKLVTGGNSAFKVTSVQVMDRLKFLFPCLPEKVIKQLIDNSNCANISLLLEMPGIVSPKVTNYIAEKCTTLPTDTNQVTCESLTTTYRPYLQSIERSFFKNLPTAVLCNTRCIELFKEKKIPKDVMKFIAEACYMDNSTSDVKTLGGLITDLPMDKFENIDVADLETNIKLIKEDLRSSKEQRERKAVVKKLAEKIIEDDKLFDIVDSKEIMKEVSLRDFENSVGQSDDVMKDLRINKRRETLGLTDSQKKWVVRQIARNKKGDTFTLKNLADMKSLVTGMLSVDIAQMGVFHVNHTVAMQYAIIMCSYTNWPRKSLQAINKHLIMTGLEGRNPYNPMSTLLDMDVQSLGCQCLLNFVPATYKNIKADVCSALCNKMGHCGSFRCLNHVRRKNILQACLKCKGLGSKAITNTDLDELGPNLISEMSRKQLDMVPPKVLQTHLEFFKDMCMSQTLREALSESLQKVIGSSGADFDRETLYLLSSAIKVLPRSLQQQLDKTVIADIQTTLMAELFPDSEEGKKLKKCCENKLNSTDLKNLEEQNFNLMLTVKEAFFANDEFSSRKKRAKVFKWTCSQIRSLPVLFATASAKEIDAMSNSEFRQCIEKIGNIKTLRHWQHKLLLSKAKTVFSKNNVCDMAIGELQELGVIALAFSIQEISCLPLSHSSLVTSLGDVRGWPAEKESALASTYMSSNSLTDLSTLTSSDITSLGSILCGFTGSQIMTIPSSEIREIVEEIGSMSECRDMQMKAYASLVVHSNEYGPINTWDEADVTELKYILIGLSGNEIQKISPNAIEELDAEVIPRIPRDVLKDLTLAQLQSFTEAQAKAVTIPQRAVMTGQQNNIIDRKIAQKNPILGADHGEESGSESLTYRWIGGLFITVAVILFIH